jgi:hypothetical protein
MHQCEIDQGEDRRSGYERRSLAPFCTTEEGVEMIAERAADKALAKLAGMFRLMWLVVVASFGVFIWLSRKGLL